ncbi:MAG: ParA family protein [Woeseia sp.]
MGERLGPITVSIINMKGGVGKSTIAALLARHAAYNLELDVLAVDLDPQANLSQAFMRGSYQKFLDSKQASIVEIFNGYQPASKSRKSPKPLDHHDAVVSVLGNERLQLVPSRFDFSDALIGSLKPNPRVLAKFVSDYFQHKDIIIIDCAPTESIFTQAAYFASALVLVPVKPEYFATVGFPLLQSSLQQFRDRNRGQQIDVCGVVINNPFYHGGNDGGPEKWRALQDIKAEARDNKWKIYKNQIPHSRGFPKMMRGDYSHLGNATMFYHFAKEFFDSIGLKG